MFSFQDRSEINNRFLKWNTLNYAIYSHISGELADANYERVKFVASFRNDLTVSEICDETSVEDTAQETKLLIKYGKRMFMHHILEFLNTITPNYDVW